MEPYYDQDGITIYHGDCREILPTLPPVDLVVTDPPYGISHKSNGQIFRQANTISGDNSTDIALAVLETLEGVPTVCFYSPYKPLPIKWRSVLVWNKGAHVGIGGDRETCWKRDFEMVGIRDNPKLTGKRDSGVISINALSPPPTGHFCEKPVTLMQRLIWKIPGELILDPFMGSGSTLVAAKLEGRRAIGIEIEEKYCEIAVNRLRQKVLF